MANNATEELIDLYGLRTARQRRRALMQDREQELIALHNERRSIWAAKGALPMIPLEEPYQRGWIRTFEVKDEVQRSEQHEFYARLLEKINTVMYDRDGRFIKKVKYRHNRKWVAEPVPQYLKTFRHWEWVHRSCPLTEKERELFTTVLHYELCGRKYVPSILYEFAEPWRYVLRIRPHMITEVQMLDADLESREQKLEQHLTQNKLEPVMQRLTEGYGKWKFRIRQPEYDPTKNVPLHALIACNEDY